MDVKDKLVSLEDVKAFYDYVAVRGDAWIDITDQLTWERPTYLFSNTSPSATFSSSDIITVDFKCATLDAQPGAIYRVTGWGKDAQFLLTYNNGNDQAYYYPYPLVLVSSISGGSVYYKFDFEYSGSAWEYHQEEFYIPYNGILHFYDFTKQFNSSLDYMVKVEKYLRYVQ